MKCPICEREMVRRDGIGGRNGIEAEFRCESCFLWKLNSKAKEIFDCDWEWRGRMIEDSEFKRRIKLQGFE